MMYQQNISDKKNLGFMTLMRPKWVDLYIQKFRTIELWLLVQRANVLPINLIFFESFHSNCNIAINFSSCSLCHGLLIVRNHQEQCALVVAFINVYISCTFDGNFFQSMNTVFLLWLPSFLSVSFTLTSHWNRLGFYHCSEKNRQQNGKKNHHSQWYLRSFNTPWIRRSNKKLGFIDLHFYEMSLYSWFFSLSILYWCRIKYM